MPDPLPPTADEIKALAARIDALEKRGDPQGKIDELKAELKKLQDAAVAKPERKFDKWGWPTD